MTVANNIVYGGTIGTSTPSGVTFSNNRNNTDPLMVSPTTYNFDLQAGSPAIDTGKSEPAVVEDYAGRARPQNAGYDVGAYEHP